MGYKRCLSLSLVFACLLCACGVPAGLGNHTDEPLPNELLTPAPPSNASSPAEITLFPDALASPDPLVYIPPTRIELPIEPLPDYAPDAEFLIVQGPYDDRFITENKPSLWLSDKNGKTLTLPAGTVGCCVDGLGSDGDYFDNMDVGPQAAFLVRDGKYAVMRLDGKVVTGFDYSLQYECDSPYWQTYKGYLLFRREIKTPKNDEPLSIYGLLDIRTGEEVIPVISNTICYTRLYDGVIEVEAFNEGVIRLIDYHGNTLYEIDREEYGRSCYLDVTNRELVQFNLPADTWINKVGDYLVLQRDDEPQTLTVLDQEYQPIHTQQHDSLWHIMGGGLLIGDGNHYTAIAPGRELIFFDLENPFNIDTAYFVGDELFLVQLEDQLRHRPPYQMIPVDAQDEIVFLESYPSNCPVMRLSPHVTARMYSNYPVAFAMTDENGRILIDYDRYGDLIEKGGFVLAYTSADDEGWNRYDIYNTEGQLLLLNTRVETRLVMPDCMILLDADIGEPVMLYNDGTMKPLTEGEQM